MARKRKKQPKAKPPRRVPTRRIPRPIVYFLVMGVVIGLIVYILSLPIWQIKEVIVNGTSMLADAEIRTMAGIPLSENLFFTSFERAEANLSRITAIEGFRFYRIPPATVLISIRERKPIAMVVFLDRSVIIDHDGYILNRNPNLTLNIPNLADLPVVTGLKERKSPKAEKIDGQTAGVVADVISKLSKFLESRRLQLDLGNLRNISFLLDDLLRVKVGRADNIARKMEVFVALLAEVSGGWEEVEYIDVRFPDNPVIKFK